MHSLITATTLLILFVWAQDQASELAVVPWGIPGFELGE